MKKDGMKDDNTDANTKGESDEVDGESEGGTNNVLNLDDRNLLNLFCPGFSNKDIADFSKDQMEQEPTAQEDMDDLDDSGDNKNLQLQFLSSLLTAIYTAKYPTLKEKTVAGKATIVPGMPANVCSFLHRAKHFLPEITKNGTAVEYPGSSFLRSAAVQLCVDLKKHYKNGSIDLCKKVICNIHE
jgi:hypothetical protein